ELKRIAPDLAPLIRADIDGTELGADDKSAYGSRAAALQTRIDKLAADADKVKDGDAAANEGSAATLKASADKLVDEVWHHSAIPGALREVSPAGASDGRGTGLGSFSSGDAVTANTAETLNPGTGDTLKAARKNAAAWKSAARQSAAGAPDKAKQE